MELRDVIGIHRQYNQRLYKLLMAIVSGLFYLNGAFSFGSACLMHHVGNVARFKMLTIFKVSVFKCALGPHFEATYFVTLCD